MGFCVRGRAVEISLFPHSTLLFSPIPSFSFHFEALMSTPKYVSTLLQPDSPSASLTRPFPILLPPLRFFPVFAPRPIPHKVLEGNRHLLAVVDAHADDIVWAHKAGGGYVEGKLSNTDLVKSHIIKYRTVITSAQAKNMGINSMYPGMGPAMADRFIEAIENPNHWSRRM